MFIGINSRLIYDDCATNDRIMESTDPLEYVMNVERIYNCNRCLSTLGPRSGYLGHGDSTYKPTQYAESQDLVDVDSILSNRNVPLSKCKMGTVNPINPTTWKEYHTPICNNRLNPEYTHLTYNRANYRDLMTDRFINPVTDPQKPIFWNFAIDTILEAKDNYNPHIPHQWTDLAGPTEDKSSYSVCKTECMTNRRCPTSWK